MSVELKSSLLSTVAGSIAGLTNIIFNGDVVYGLVVAGLSGASAYTGQMIVKYAVSVLKKKFGDTKK